MMEVAASAPAAVALATSADKISELREPPTLATKALHLWQEA